MRPEELPGELNIDYASLKFRLVSTIDIAISIGEDKARQIFFQVFRDLLSEKDLQGDQVALDVLNWAYEELANRVPLE